MSSFARTILRLSVTLTIVLVATALPVPAQAETFFGPIVPPECNCEAVVGDDGVTTYATAPSYGCVLATIQRIVNFAITIGMIGAVIAIVFAGFTWMMSGGNPEKRSQGRSMLINVAIGMVIVLSAWLIVDFVMKSLYDSGHESQGVEFGPWNEILAGAPDDLCIVKTQTQAITGIGGISTGIFGGDVEYGSGGGGTQTGTGGTANGQVLNGTGSTNLNVNAAVSYLTSHARSRPTSQCWAYVRRAICAGGLQRFCSGTGNAGSQGPVLLAAGYAAVYTGRYSGASQTAMQWQAGDVVIFQPVPGHSIGHAAMYTGSRWVSDYVQPRMDSNFAHYQGGQFTVYRPR